MAVPGCYYIHKKTGARYKVLRTLPVRTDGAWVPGCLYENVYGDQYAQSRVRFEESFDHADDCGTHNGPAKNGGQK